MAWLIRISFKRNSTVALAFRLSLFRVVSSCRDVPSSKNSFHGGLTLFAEIAESRGDEYLKALSDEVNHWELR